MTMSALVRDYLGRVSIRNRENELYRDRAETIQVISHLIAIQRYIRDLAS